MSAYHLRTITVLGRPMRLFASPLPGPDYPWVALADLLAPGAAGTQDYEDYAERLSVDQPQHAVHVLTAAGQELVVSSFVVAGILEHWAAERVERAHQARVEFDEGLGELFAMQHAHLPHPEFRRICLIAATRHEPAAGHA